jgi:hypothetical protein
MSNKQPDPVVQRRHEAAMEVIHHVGEEDRILVLGYVTGLIPPSPEFERLEAENPPVRNVRGPYRKNPGLHAGERVWLAEWDRRKNAA